MPRLAYRELSVDLIDEGKLKKKIDAEIRRVFRELREFHKETGVNGKAIITSRISINRAKGSSELFEVKYVVASKTPTMEKATLVKEKNGRLLCRPEGSSDDSPDQQVLEFDEAGRPIAGVDPETGEEYGKTPADESPSIAGRVNSATG